MKYVPRILIHELVFQSTRSRGPGGQNVNRTNSAVIVHWNIRATESFTRANKEILLNKLSTKMTNEGEVVIRSDEFRNQEANRKRCLEKLETLLQAAFYKPKKRKKTKPTQSSVEKRYELKRRRALTKKLRVKVHID